MPYLGMAGGFPQGPQGSSNRALSPPFAGKAEGLARGGGRGGALSQPPGVQRPPDGRDDEVCHQAPAAGAPCWARSGALI